MIRSLNLLVTAVVLSWSVTGAYASIAFYPTSDEGHWQVALNYDQPDGALSSFQTSTFGPAVPITNTPLGRDLWIANNNSGTNGDGTVGRWSFFVFRQTFDLTGYDPTTANLQFKWAADDAGLDPSGSYPNSGTWKPKYRLNGASFVDGVWSNGVSYFVGDTTEISSGFIPGLNTLDFYVEGNGVTDGFYLETSSFTADLDPNATPEPLSLMVWVGLIAATAGAGRRMRS